MLAEGNQASSKGNTGTGHGLGVQHFPSVPKTRSHTESLWLHGLSPRVTCRVLGGSRGKSHSPTRHFFSS